MALDAPAEERGLSLADYLTVIRSYWLGILLFTAVATAGAFGWYLVQPRVYAADSTGLVVTAGAENLNFSLAGDTLAKSKAKSYKSVGESVLVADRVIKALGLDVSAQSFDGRVTVAVLPDTAEIKVTVRSSDPREAQTVADAWVTALAAQVYSMEKANTTAGMEPASKVVALAKATVPTAPVSPNLRLALGIGAAGGLLAGFAYAFVRNHLDRRIRAGGEIERRFRVPVVGTLPLDKRLSGATRVLDDVAGSGSNRGAHAMAEALRELRTNLSFVDVDNPPRILLVTSSLPSEGKSTVIGNLAATIAAAGEEVIVVDGDLRRPTVHKVFDIVGDVGVTDVLTGRAAIDEVLQSWGPMPHLRILAAGRIPPNPSELLGSRAMGHLLESLSQRAVVLVDTPPLLPVTDAAVLSRVADGTLVVARARKTTTDSLDRALRNLARVRGRMLGVILNCVATKGPDNYSYGYYGTYTSGRGGKGKARRGTAASAPARVTPAAPAFDHAAGPETIEGIVATEPVLARAAAQLMPAEPVPTQQVQAWPVLTEPAPQPMPGEPVPTGRTAYRGRRSAG
ncbi:polysaccharide biosynthesis tyrosine autokinase [Sinomonas sp. ASV322]|uniref:polysaccharide biosynthesis tyrosine autokinase n=1 Tax=Sinomonas sp. ASV322 TaxID=3041920 RepID=UPI0027DCAB1A|nr:polysaccharide biosynthesis tyrosine autokinase [Sinomonas sp. ASV322]MDQ4501643.1 polysaccharide biosynthesis tyrosine autokinase [Sinomonas sp. ASV322]